MSEEVFSAADLAAPVERAETTVELTGIGKTFRLRAWSADNGLKVDVLAAKVKEGTDATELFSAMLVPSVIDSAGKPVFTPPTFKQFMTKVSQGDLLTLIKAVGKLNERKKDEDKPAEGEASPPTDA